MDLWIWLILGGWSGGRLHHGETGFCLFSFLKIIEANVSANPTTFSCRVFGPSFSLTISIESPLLPYL